MTLTANGRALKVKDKVSEPDADEIQDLQSCVRDLAALSALSAAWSRADVPGIADSFAEVLQRILRTDLLFVHLESEPSAIDVAITPLGKQPADRVREIGEALRPLFGLTESDTPPDLAGPVGAGILRLTINPIGYRGEFGVVVAGSRRVEFPSNSDRLLLGVSANQAATVLQQKRSEREIMRLYETLRESEQRKDEFLATLAHELRNPLAPIRSSLEIMSRAGGDATLIEGARGTMERQVRQMVRLVDDLLDISRVTRGQLELRKEWMDLGAAIESAVEASRPLIEASRHQLTVSVPPVPVRFHGDQARLAQVFSNLLNNAAKYTGPGGQIAIKMESDENEIIISVRDNGIGIAPDMLERIFEIFMQIDPSRDRSRGGLGIGLMLVKRLVEMHGGGITALSDGAGRGSEFVARLPINMQEPSTPSEGIRPAITPMPLADWRILVVDDNKDAADTLSLILSMSGSEVRTVYDGSSAIRAAADFQPAVILLDIGLPGMDGYAAAEMIRRQNGEDVVLIALTGWGQADDRRRSKESGFNHHMVKPVDPDELQLLLSELRQSPVQ